MTVNLVGTVHQMTVQEVSDQGYLLLKGTEKAILPNEVVERKLEVDDSIDVFVYHDKRGKLIATAELPKVVRGLYSWVEVIEAVPNLGVFVDIGAGVEVLVSMDD